MACSNMTTLSEFKYKIVKEKAKKYDQYQSHGGVLRDGGGGDSAYAVNEDFRGKRKTPEVYKTALREDLHERVKKLIKLPKKPVKRQI